MKIHVFRFQNNQKVRYQGATVLVDGNYINVGSLCPIQLKTLDGDKLHKVHANKIGNPQRIEV